MRIHAVAGVRETWSAVVFAWGLVGIRKKLLGVFLLCGMPSAHLRFAFLAYILIAFDSLLLSLILIIFGSLLLSQ